MPKVTQTSERKADHIRINLEKEVGSGITTGFENYTFIHEALPEINLSDIDLNSQFFGKTLNSPLLISSMTGGTAEALQINRRLAQAAQESNVAMGVGSQRAAVEDPSIAKTFQVRGIAPDIMLFANLGAIQLNYGYTTDHCRKAVEMIGADALILHLNALQEAVQPEGDVNFAGLLSKIEKVCHDLEVPVIAKEVGWGFSAKTARRLIDAGVSAIDVAGAGGTSWTQVEMHRATSDSQARLAAAFLDWGIPTSESIQLVREASLQIPIIASGGLRSGIDIAKSIALGANLGGIASPFLKAAVESTELVVQVIDEIRNEIRVSMFASGAATIQQLSETPLRKR
jgi:isopentenyl-diphosphate delta-isomerase